MTITKKTSSKLIFYNEKKIQKDSNDFWRRKSTFESQIEALFENLFESQWKSNLENIFLSLIFSPVDSVLKPPPLRSRYYTATATVN